MSTSSIAPRIPNFEETQQHLRSLGLDLVDSANDPSAEGKYAVRNRNGRVWAWFDSLLDLWNWWMLTAARKINAYRFLRAFVDEFRRAEKGRRHVMVKMAEGVYTRASADLNEWKRNIPFVDAADLPDRWEDELLEYWTGEFQGRDAAGCLVALLAAEDEDAKRHFERFSESLGLPAATLVT